ncbi:MAG TPA: ATP-binding protein [Vicinamibacterales bacterium]
MASEAELLHRIAELEEELRAQREERESVSTILDLVMRQMPALYWIVDRELHVLRSGGEITGITGYRTGQFRGSTLQQVANTDRMTTDTVANHRRALAGELVFVETEYRGKWLATVIGPYRRGGEIVGAIGTSIDVTAWRTLERRMVDAQRAESLGVLAGGLAHDFNNLLVGILGNANLALLDLPDDSPVRALVRQIQAAAERSADLTRQLLAYAGRGQHVVTRVNLSSLVQELSTLLLAALSKHARLEQRLDPGVPDVLGDPAQITQVVMNLLTNASEAVGEDPGVVSVRTRLVHLLRPVLDGLYLGSDLPEGPYVSLEVADTGHGMSAETVARIFDPFFTTKFTGRGLGLAAVLGIVRTHRGALDVETAEGIGTTFRIYLPAVQMTQAAVPPPELARRGQAGGLVLVVDDEPAVRLVARRFLERWGFEVVEAENGVKAVELAEHLGDRLRLALVDLTMPYQDGRATLHALREWRADLPVVLMSGYTEQAAGGEVDRGRHVGFVQKPFTATQLRRVVEEALAE